MRTCNKCVLHRPYEVFMWPCLMRSECLATAARIPSVSHQSNSIRKVDWRANLSQRGRSSQGLSQNSGSDSFLELSRHVSSESPSNN